MKIKNIWKQKLFCCGLESDLQYIQPTCRTSFGVLDVCFLLSTAGNRGYLYLNASFASDWTDCMCKGFQVVAVQYLYNRYDAPVKKGALVQEEKSNHATLEDSPHITIVRCGWNSPPPTKRHKLSAPTVSRHQLGWGQLPRRSGFSQRKNQCDSNSFPPFKKKNTSNENIPKSHIRLKNLNLFLIQKFPFPKNIGEKNKKNSPHPFVGSSTPHSRRLLLRCRNTRPPRAS